MMRKHKSEVERERERGKEGKHYDHLILFHHLNNNKWNQDKQQKIKQKNRSNDKQKKVLMKVVLARLQTSVHIGPNGIYII